MAQPSFCTAASAKRQTSWRKEDEAFCARALALAARAKETGIVFRVEKRMQSLHNILSNKRVEHIKPSAR